MVDVRVAELVGISKTYSSSSGKIAAVRGVSLTLWPGELVCLMGVSGSGKSTLIGILAGLLRMDEGSATVVGVDLVGATRETRSAFRRSRASVVFQEFNLVSLLTVIENVALPLEVSGVSRHQSRSRSEVALASLGLADKQESYPGELSGGQRQRVAIARAMTGDHRVILADEPTGALDSATAEQVRDAFLSARALGKTVLVATHDPAFATVADRVLHMSDGRIVEPVAG